MVWSLIPIEPVRGAQKYYIFTCGIYKVGRKDCDVIVQTDTSISRVHAEIVIDKMLNWDYSQSGSAASPSSIRLTDCSRYGTFVKKELHREANHIHKDEEAVVQDGDVVTFGTGSATFRFSFIPFVVFLHGKRSSRLDPSLQTAMTSIGAYATRKWSNECTHAIVDSYSSLTMELIEVVLAKKEIITGDWFKILSEQKIQTDIPSCAPYVPRLNLDGTEIITVESKLREKCLAGHTFVLKPKQKYKFGEKLHQLLEFSGAKCLLVDEYCSNSQVETDGENNQIILVLPASSPVESNMSRELSSLPKVTDLKLCAAIFSGRLEAAMIEPPSFIVTSSRSTDETVVADSDVEVDTATSNHIGILFKPIDCQQQKQKTLEYKNDTKDLDERGKVYSISANPSMAQTSKEPKEGDIRTTRGMECDDSIVKENENSDVIFCENLVIQAGQLQSPNASTEQCVNFKRFKKREMTSGNSFNDLVPFAKEPYKESENKCNSTSEFVREEKRRKRVEAVADDLFNNEKRNKRSFSGTSIHALLATR